jgi:hypothetical protein
VRKTIWNRIEPIVRIVFALLSPFSALNSLRPERRANVSPNVLLARLQLTGGVEGSRSGPMAESQRVDMTVEPLDGDGYLSLIDVSRPRRKR